MGGLPINGGPIIGGPINLPLPFSPSILFLENFKLAATCSTDGSLSVWDTSNSYFENFLYNV